MDDGKNTKNCYTTENNILERELRYNFGFNILKELKKFKN